MIVIIIMFGWVVLNITAGAKLVDEYTPISYELSVILVGVVILLYLLAGFCIPMASPELWQRIYAIKDQRHFKRSLFLSSLFYFIIGFILLMIGLVIRADIPGISPAKKQKEVRF